MSHEVWKKLALKTGASLGDSTELRDALRSACAELEAADARCAACRKAMQYIVDKQPKDACEADGLSPLAWASRLALCVLEADELLDTPDPAAEALRARLRAAEAQIAVYREALLDCINQIDAHGPRDKYELKALRNGRAIIVQPDAASEALLARLKAAESACELSALAEQKLSDGDIMDGVQVHSDATAALEAWRKARGP